MHAYPHADTRLAGPDVRPAFRSRPLHQTLAAVTELATAAGITRVADITGLDHLGLPVFAVIRPNSKSLSVSSGKGLTPYAARVSGLMEAFELFHAEEAKPTARYADLERHVLVPDPQTLPMTKGRAVSPFQPNSAMNFGVELFSGQVAAVPHSLVHVRISPDWHKSNDGYLVSSNGLASGNDAEEAILHGACEVIERDALALLEARDPAHSMRGERQLRWRSIDDATTWSLCNRIYEAGLDVLLFDITTDISVPTCYCRIASRKGAAGDVIASDGSGCHPDKHVAIQRAILEAAQTRLTIISGAREDIDDRCYGTQRAAESLPESHFDFEFGVFKGAETSRALEAVKEALRAAGFNYIIAVDLCSRSEHLKVMRVVVPDLEGSPHSRFYAPGRRARRCS